MGMDVYGIEPTDPKGEYFRRSMWGWRPLWDTVTRFSPNIIDENLHAAGHFNDGYGLLGEKARELSEHLFKLLDTGAITEYVAKRSAELLAMEDEDCTICGGTGKRLPPPVVGPGDEPCNGCGSTGKVRPSACSYRVDVTDVVEFAEFLKHCGGFRIY